MIEVENGTKLYFAGDTCVFGDMALIGRIYEPDVAVLPIGGHYTMDPREAAVAVELLGVGRCIPCHYGTFPLLAGTPDECRELLTTSCEIIAPEPGVTVTVWMRERWFGATGRRVPEIAVEGEIELEGALVLDDVADEARSARRTPPARPVVVRAADPESVAPGRWPRGRVRPRPTDRRDLLDLDLRRITYG